MYWPLLIAGALSIIALMRAGVHAAAFLVGRLPGAMLRKWSVILSLFIALSLLAVVIVQGEKSPIPVVVRQLFDADSKLPSLRGAIVAWVLTLLIALPISAAAALSPIPKSPYRPRGNEWSWTRTARYLVITSIVFGLFIAGHDFEMRWRLNSFASDADRLAATMVPPPVPGDQNAARHYQQACEIVEQQEEWANDAFRFQSFEQRMADSPQDPLLQEYLDRFKPAIDELTLAASLPQCRFDAEYQPVDLLAGPDAYFELNRAIVAFCRWADREVRQGNSAAVIDLVRAIRALQRHLQMDARNMGTPYYMWHEGFQLRSLELALTSEHPPTDDQLAALQELTSAPLEVDAIHQAVCSWQGAIARRFIADWYMGRLFDNDEYAPVGGWSQIGGDGEKVKASYAATSFLYRLLFCRDDLEAVRQMYPVSSDTNGNNDQLRVVAESVDIDRDDQGAWSYLVSSVTTSRFYAEFAEADRRISTVAIAAARYRDRKGRWPDRFDQLVPEFLPEIPVCPMTNAPLTMFDVDDGLLIYVVERAKDQDFFANFDNSERWWTDFRAMYGVRFAALGDAYGRAHPPQENR